MSADVPSQTTSRVVWTTTPSGDQTHGTIASGVRRPHGSPASAAPSCPRHARSRVRAGDARVRRHARAVRRPGGGPPGPPRRHPADGRRPDAARLASGSPRGARSAGVHRPVHGGQLVTYTWHPRPDLVGWLWRAEHVVASNKSLPAASLVAARETIHRGQVVVEYGLARDRARRYPRRAEHSPRRRARPDRGPDHAWPGQLQHRRETSLSINSVSRTSDRPTGRWASSWSQAVLWGVRNGYLEELPLGVEPCRAHRGAEPHRREDRILPVVRGVRDRTSWSSRPWRPSAAGFEALWISDHFHPWNDEQGQSPFVWSVIGALSQVCRPAGHDRGDLPDRAHPSGHHRPGGRHVGPHAARGGSRSASGPARPSTSTSSGTPGPRSTSGSRCWRRPST